jgi:hypothetical protein
VIEVVVVVVVVMTVMMMMMMATAAMMEIASVEVRIVTHQSTFHSLAPPAT